MLQEQNQVRQMRTEHAPDTTAACRRCGRTTSQRLVLRTDEHTIRASLWLCPACHQPAQHRATDGPAAQSGEATPSATSAPPGA